MLAAFLLAGLVAAPIATVALFTTSPRRGRTTGAWPATRRLGLSVVATLVLGAVVGGILLLLGTTRTNTVAGVAGLLAVSAVWLPATRHWSARAHLAWSATTYLFLAYLAFMLWWTFVSDLGIAGTIGALVLWLIEALRRIPRRRVPLGALRRAGPRGVGPPRDGTARAGTVPDDRLPFVSLQVPAYNEPPEMVIETLQSLVALDYPAYEIIVIDDNTDDEALWRPVEAWCLEHGVKFAHLADWPGYKSGALNYALREMVDPRTELIGVIDADYQLDPDFLRACAPLFADPTGRLHPGAAGLSRLGAGAVLPPALLLLQVLLRRLAALPQRTRRRDLRRHDGPDPQRTPWSRRAAGTSGASPRTPSSRSACCATAGRDCTSTVRSAWASCR